MLKKAKSKKQITPATISLKQQNFFVWEFSIFFIMDNGTIWDEV